MSARQCLRWLCVFLGASLCTASPPLEARVNHADEAEVEQAIEQAIDITNPSVAGERVKIRRRDDLEEDLSTIDKKAAGNVSFYDLESPAAAAAYDDSMWAVVWGHPGRDSYRLYSFDSSQEFQQLTQEFDRLMAQLTVFVPVNKAPDLARFFLQCCVRDAPGQVVDDDDALHHTVERYYLQAFGDVWRALEESMDWWQGYEETTDAPMPVITADYGAWRIVLRRVFLSFGMHPQVQQWDFRVGSDGKLQVSGVDPVFPKRALWLSYDFRSTITPLKDP